MYSSGFRRSLPASAEARLIVCQSSGTNVLSAYTFDPVSGWGSVAQYAAASLPNTLNDRDIQITPSGKVALVGDGDGGSDISYLEFSIDDADGFTLDSSQDLGRVYAPQFTDTKFCFLEDIGSAGGNYQYREATYNDPGIASLDSITEYKETRLRTIRLCLDDDFVLLGSYPTATETTSIDRSDFSLVDSKGPTLESTNNPFIRVSPVALADGSFPYIHIADDTQNCARLNTDGTFGSDIIVPWTSESADTGVVGFDPYGNMIFVNESGDLETYSVSSAGAVALVDSIDTELGGSGFITNRFAYFKDGQVLFVAGHVAPYVVAYQMSETGAIEYRYPDPATAIGGTPTSLQLIQDSFFNM